LDQPLHEGNDRRHRARDRGILVRPQHVQRVHRLEVRVAVLLGDLLRAAMLRIRAGDDLVVDVSEVLYVAHGVAAILQIAAQDVGRHEDARVADVRVELRRHAADVHADHVADGDELFLLAAERVGDFHHGAASRVGVSASSAARSIQASRASSSITFCWRYCSISASGSGSTSTRRRSWVTGSCVATTRPGTPTTVECGGTEFRTTDPAPIFTLSPISIAPSTFAPTLITTLLPIVGWRLPVSLPVPPSVTPWYSV